MDLDTETCSRARRSRDSRFDGRFFIGVRTTGIYCRPICPAPSPKESNVRYFPSAAGAAEAGFRPCLRCRPEASPGTPAWLGSSTTVSRALRLMEEDQAGNGSLEHLADRLGIGSRQLRRLFLQHLGATPVAVLQTRRLHFAKTLIDQTDLPFTEAALAAGFGSVRRFNSSFQKLYHRTPSELRALARRRGPAESGQYRFRLRFRPPFDWPALLAFLVPRAIPGVEAVDSESYRRTISLQGHHGIIEVRCGDALELQIVFPSARALMTIVERVRRLFDLRADPPEISAHLAGDPLLSSRVASRPGLRVPGAWDAFELAVRVILGQQVSVKGASTLAGRLVQAFGEPLDAGCGLTHLFPEPAVLAEADCASIGLPAARGETIRRLAGAVARGEIVFGSSGDPARFLERLQSLPGIGEWTAQYIAMRALGEPDAFPAGDLGLLRASGAASSKLLEQR